MTVRSLPGTTQGQHNFARVPHSNVPSSAFNRSCGMKTTMEFGELVPVFADEALPGDTMIMNPTMFVRMATQIRPILDNMYIDLHWWAVPNRIIWDNWQKFCGEQIDPGDSTSFEVPLVTVGAGFAVDGFYDHLGIIPGVAHAEVTNLFGRAYRKIWNQWYRDQNMQDSVHEDSDDGPDTLADYDTLLPRGKRHDYFTSCLPWPQKGISVELPLGSTAEVTGGPITYQSIGTPTTTGKIGVGGSPFINLTLDAGVGASGDVKIISGLTADLATASAATINQLRQSISIQRLYEKDARAGTRYKEILLSHFGKTVKDSRLQRPEYLGGGTVNVGVNQVVQQSAFGRIGGDSEFLGDLGGWALANHTGNGFSKTFEEHCVIIGIASARADLNYQQGLDRMHSRRTRWDYYWPELANIGEQAVLNKEIWADGSANDDLVFGYQTRFAEYRYKPSQITSTFRTDHAQSLDLWHLAQHFSSLPALGPAFIEENPPIARIIAVPTEPALLADFFFAYKSVRPMPQYGVPGLTRL